MANANKSVDFNFDEFDNFFKKLSNAARGEFKKELSLWLEAIGIEFLGYVEDEIKRLQVVDMRHLLNSFHKSGESNVWEIKEGGLVLQVGTNLEYASFVNDGHWTIDPTKNKHFTLPNGEIARFVPGTWRGDHFIYNKNAKTGMVLKQKWIEPKPYWDHAVDIMEKMFPKFCERKLQQWLDRYFG